MHIKKRYITLIVLIILTIVTFSFLQHKYYFTINKWTNYQGNSRYYLYDDLMKKYDFIGMKRDDVIKILGNSDSRYYDEDSNLAYYLGVPPLNIDAYHLIFELNDKNLIEKIYIKND